MYEKLSKNKLSTKYFSLHNGFAEYLVATGYSIFQNSIDAIIMLGKLRRKLCIPCHIFIPILRLSNQNRFEVKSTFVTTFSSSLLHI